MPGKRMMPGDLACTGLFKTLGRTLMCLQLGHNLTCLGVLGGVAMRTALRSYTQPSSGTTFESITWRRAGQFIDYPDTLLPKPFGLLPAYPRLTLSDRL